MAVVRSGRSSPPYALIIFIVLWLLSTGLAVYLYTQLDKTNQEREAERATYKKWVDPDNEKSLAEKLALEGKGVTPKALTALGVAHAQNTRLIDMIAGTDAATADDALAAGAGTLNSLAIPAGQNKESFKYPSLVGAAKTLSQELLAERQRAAELNTKLEALTAQIAAAKENFDTSVKAGNDTIEQRKAEIAALTDKLGKTETTVTETKSAYETRLSGLTDNMEKMQRTLLAKQTQLQDQLTFKDAEIRSLKKQIELLTPSVKTLAGMEPDGRLIRASIGSDEVWINLGRKDHVTPGLTFTVYDPKAGVGSGPDGAGKAQIEVVQVGEDQSMARVTNRQKNQTVSTDDLVANMAYNRNKNRVFHFVLYGDFDLDADGSATASERDRLVRLVQSWGGVVDDKLTTQTDFLVTGTPPAHPVNKTDAPTDQTTDLNNQRVSQQKQYQDMIAQAKDFSVPVLNANRFLSLIGYYNTTIVRY